jgi:PKD repeat protein
MEYKAHWYFGDGEESTEYSPTHIYKMAGEYSVILIREFSNGTVTRNNFTIYVYEWQIGERLHVVYTNNQ